MDRQHPVGEERKKSDAFFFVIRHRHLLTKHLSMTPTAIGRISGGEPGLSFERAMRLPPVNLETIKGTFPDARGFTISLREEQIVFCNLTSTASSTC